MLHELERWAAEARARDAAEGRARMRDLRQAAGEDAGFVGCLLDLAETGGPVVITTVRGTSHAGQIVAVGEDFVGLRTLGHRVVLVAFATVADVSPAPTAVRPGAGGDRNAATLEVALADMLASAAAARSRLSVRCGERVLNGEVRSVGRDVVTVTAPGLPVRPSYVMLRSVSEVSFLDSG